MNKKGAELTIGTLVVIVLAIIVLVVLALGFGTGWSNLWSKVSGMSSPVNVDAVKQACVYACTTQAEYDYCCRARNVVVEINGKKDTERYKEKTCKELESAGLGFEPCDNIDCSGVTCPKSCTGTATACDKLDSENACNKQEGCQWQNNRCIGTATACDKLDSKDACNKQEGCLWE